MHTLWINRLTLHSALSIEYAQTRLRSLFNRVIIDFATGKRITYTGITKKRTGSVSHENHVKVTTRDSSITSSQYSIE